MYTLELKGELDHFLYFSTMTLDRVRNGDEIQNAWQQVFGYYRDANGPEGIKYKIVTVSAVSPCAVAQSPINGPATATTVPAPNEAMPLATAEMSVHVACGGGYQANLYIARGSDTGLFGLYYPGTAIRQVADSVVNFSGEQWPAMVVLTDSRGRTVDIKITEHLDCVTVDTTGTVQEASALDSNPTLLPETGILKFLSLLVAATTISACGVLMVLVGRRPGEA